METGQATRHGSPNILLQWKLDKRQDMADPTSCYNGNWTSDKTWLTQHLVTGTVTLWTLDNRPDIGGQPSCYRDSNVMDT